MEENNVNIGEILKDAPRGLKLYSPIFGEVELNCVYDTVGERNAIETFDSRRYSRLFSSNGKFHNCPDGKCMLFPSEKHRSWVEWQKVLFKRGDVISDGEETYIFRSKGNVNLRITTKKGLNILLFETLSLRYATTTEREHFFKELENNGYRWDDTIKEIVKIKCRNSEHNTNVDDLLKNNTFHYPEQETEVEVTPDGCYKCVLKSSRREPMFKVDDILRYSGYDKKLYKITNIELRLYTLVELENKANYKILTFDFVEKQFDKIEGDNNSSVSEIEELKQKPFSIKDLKPFEKVLVRNDKKNKWVVDFFSYYESDDKAFICGGGSWWRYCIPFNNETANLVGTNNDYPTYCI